jgi:hypothetical protein
VYYAPNQGLQDTALRGVTLYSPYFTRPAVSPDDLDRVKENMLWLPKGAITGIVYQNIWVLKQVLIGFYS